MTNLIFAQILSLMTLLVAPEAAEGSKARGHHGKGAALCERLECTDAQRTSIEAIRAEHRRAVEDERAEVKRLHQALNAEQRVAEPDAEKLASLQSRLEAVKTELRQARSETKAEISAVLTPAQRERIAAMKAEHRSKRDKGEHAKGKRGKGEHAKGKHAKGKHAKGELAKGKRGKGEHAKGKHTRGPQGKVQAKRGRGGPRAFAAG
jgi:Spy/CpxP family protein refolding chaperone